MYEELVKRLRADADYMDNNGIMLYAAAPFYRECADAIEELSREYESVAASLNESVELVRKLQSPRWGSVEEWLPEDSGDYLVYDSCGNIFQNFYGTEVKRWSARSGIVTHWMPLPPAPEPPMEKA